MTTMTTVTRIAIAVAGSLFLFHAAACAEDTRDIRLLKAIIAKVNGLPITRDDLTDEYEFMLRMRFGKQRPRLTDEESATLQDAALREIIKMRLIADEAKIKEIKADSDRVDQHLRRMRLDPKDAEPLARKMAESEVLFDQILVKDGILPYTPSPLEIRTFFAKNIDAFREECMIKVRSLFLPVLDDRAVNPVLQKAEAMRKEVLEKPVAERSALFAEKARLFSQDAFADQGGLLRISGDPEGWFNQAFPNVRRDNKPIFPDAEYKGIRGLTQKGEVSPPLRAPEGIHLLFLEDIRGGKVMAKDEAFRMIEFKLGQAERRKRLQKWLKEKIERSQVTWHDDDPYPPDRILDPPDAK